MRFSTNTHSFELPALRDTVLLYQWMKEVRGTERHPLQSACRYQFDYCPSSAMTCFLKMFSHSLLPLLQEIPVA